VKAQRNATLCLERGEAGLEMGRRVVAHDNRDRRWERGTIARRLARLRGRRIHRGQDTTAAGGIAPDESFFSGGSLERTIPR
jgi:hypothetical protein